MKKRIFTFIIILFISFNFLIPPKKAQAIPALLPLFYTLAPEVIPTIVQLLISGGLTYTTIDSMMKSVNEYGNTLPGQQFITDLDNQLKASTFNDVIMIPNEKWNEFRTWIQSKFISGTNTYKGSELFNVPYIPDLPSDCTYPYWIILMNSQGVIDLWNSDQPFYMGTSTNGDYFMLKGNYRKYYMSGSGTSVYWTKQIDSWSSSYSGIETGYQALYDYNGTIYNDSSLSVPATIDEPYQVTGEDVLNNPDWDWVNSNTGIKELPVTMFPEGTTLDSEAVNSSLNQLLNKTYNDVISLPIDTGEEVIAQPTDEVGFWESTFKQLSAILQGVKSIPDKMQEIQDKNDEVPTEVSIDLRPLQISLRDRFPFCIPFDFVAAIGLLVAPSQSPVFDVQFPSDLLLGGGSFTFDFSKYNKLVLIARFFFLYEFLVGLMRITKQLQRGDS